MTQPADKRLVTEATAPSVFRNIWASVGDFINAATDFGVSPSNSATQNSTQLQAAMDAAAAAKKELFLPAGNYPVNPGLVWDHPIVKFRGAGSKDTVLSFSRVDADGIVFGQAAYVDDLGSQGYVGGFKVVGPTDAPPTPNYKVGVTFRDLKFTYVHDIYEAGFDIGFAPIGNCYGITFDTLMARYSKSNIGLDLRSTDETGNDIPFYNCWLSGLTAAINESGPLSGGYVFYSGQFAAGDPNGGIANDDAACVRIGRSWAASPVDDEIGRIYFVNGLFESPVGAWVARAYTPVAGLDFTNCTFNSYGPMPAQGIYKNTLPYHDRVTFDHCRIEGSYLELLNVPQPSGGNCTYLEQGTIGRPSVGGNEADLYSRGLLDRSTIGRGVAMQGGPKSTIYLDGLRLRNNAGTLEKSTDGTTWSAV